MPFWFVTLNGRAAAVSSSNSMTSSVIAMFGSVKSGKKASPLSTKALGVMLRGASTVPVIVATARDD